jgi:quinoprotein glucose dehydrogenase
MRTRPLATALALLIANAGSGLAPDPAFALPLGYTVETLQSSLSFPVAFRFAPDGRLFYLERASGRIMTLEPPYTGTPVPWATVSTVATGERGLLGLAFHPDFPDSPYVYVFHTNLSPFRNRVARLADVGGVGVNYASIVDSLPAASSIHHGGRIAFGPDGMLWVTFGDQATAATAESVTELRGKILRYTPLGRPAPGNPFGFDNPAAAYGVRNPFGLCFDPLTGWGFFTENGPDCDDEINFLTIGADYGWGPDDPCGGQPAPSTPALTSFTPTIAPTGCCVYRGAEEPLFDGNLFVASYNDAAIRRLVFRPGNPTIVDTLEVFHSLPLGGILDVQVGPDGRLWFSTFDGLFRIVPGVLDVGPTAARPGFDVMPNPSTGAVSFRLGDPRGVRRVEILDLAGRLVRRWSGPFTETLRWDGEDRAGRTAREGVYVARVQDDRGVIAKRLVRIAR